MDLIDQDRYSIYHEQSGHRGWPKQKGAIKNYKIRSNKIFLEPPMPRFLEATIFGKFCAIWKSKIYQKFQNDSMLQHFKYLVKTIKHPEIGKSK